MKMINRSMEYEVWSRILFFTLIGFSVLTSYSLLLTPVPALAQTEYKLLAPIPLEGAGSAPTRETKAGPYIKSIFTLIIAVAGGLAVIKIIFGGIQYMSTDAFTGKSEAKETIKNAIWGLLLAISAWLILFTINPDLVNFNLSIPRQEIRGPTGGSGREGPAVHLEDCLNCEVLGAGLNSKLPMTSPAECGRPGGCGCAYPGPCTVTPTLNNKLVALNGLNTFLITESFPPTRSHVDPCHGNGTCIDATTLSRTPQSIQKFINDNKTVGLRAEYEVASEARAQAIREATGLSASQVRVVPGITGEHYSIYMN